MFKYFISYFFNKQIVNAHIVGGQSGSSGFGNIIVESNVLLTDNYQIKQVEKDIAKQRNYSQCAIVNVNFLGQANDSGSDKKRSVKSSDKKQ